MTMDRLMDDLTVYLEHTDIRTLDLIANLFLGQAVLVFVFSLFKEAMYGKYLQAGTATVNAKLAWLVLETPAICIPIVLLFTKGSRVHKSANLLFVSLFIIHYIHRSIIFPLLNKGRPFPVLVFVVAAVYATTNTYLQCVYLLYHADFPEDWAAKPNVWIGVVLFFVGFAINVHSDHLLRTLRKPGETTYKIPRGGMFKYVSGANFFGEIIEWTGFALASWSYPAFAFAVASAGYLGMRGYHHHRYYLRKFDNYPKSRKALIPFIF